MLQQCTKRASNGAKSAQTRLRANREVKEKKGIYLVEFDDVWVVQQLHDLHFSVNLFQVGRTQAGLVNNFYCHLQ